MQTSDKQPTRLILTPGEELTVVVNSQLGIKARLAFKGVMVTSEGVGFEFINLDDQSQYFLTVEQVRELFNIPAKPVTRTLDSQVTYR
jgi:hypothetical protein